MVSLSVWYVGLLVKLVAVGAAQVLWRRSVTSLLVGEGWSWKLRMMMMMMLWLVVVL